MPRALMITGTDTGIGKTHVACTLLRTLHARGQRAVGMKPVASGCTCTVHGWRNADALALQATSLPVPCYLDVNPYPLPAATAPSLAARAAGITVDMAVIEAAFMRLASNADMVVVEGVGGWATPLDDGMQPITSAADRPPEHAHLAQRLGADVVLVVGLRLGCLNHARLSARAIVADGCRWRGWIGNCIDPDFTPLDDYLDLLRTALAAPCLGVLTHHQGSATPAELVALDLTRLLG